jgi:hypothetical protein
MLRRARRRIVRHDATAAVAVEAAAACEAAVATASRVV